MYVRPKKHLGQHFITDLNICKKIVDGIPEVTNHPKLLEIGPGTGALTQFLLERQDFDTHVIELDHESVDYLKLNYPALDKKIFGRDFLKTDLAELMGESPFILAGNFPYNISSQILFKVLDYRNQIPIVVGMFQKEVAERVAEQPGSKTYGILSVLLQAYYDIEYLFTVSENVFNPPPKVKSGVIRLVRNKNEKLDCDEKLFKQVIKAAFNQRRKTLRNSLKQLIPEHVDKSDDIFSLRPERLSVDDFIQLTQRLMDTH